MKKNQHHSKKSTVRIQVLAPAFVVGIAAIIMFISLSSFQDTLQPEVSDTIAADTTDTTAASTDSLPSGDTIAAPLGENAVDSVIAEGQEVVEEPLFFRGEYTSQHARRGERLFNGLVPYTSGTHNCASCHYLAPEQEINWNPSAHDLAVVWQQNPEYDLLQMMNQPLSERLMQDHAGMTITREEAHMLEAFFTKKAEGEVKPLIAYPVRAALFWGMGALMLLAIIDLFFTRKIRFKAVHILILLAGIGVHTELAVTEAIALGRTPEYAPSQPIKFSHLIHSGENNIDCKYCHFSADYSISANIPSNNVCLNCHNVIRSGQRSGTFEINKIHRAVVTGEPIEWIRIHDLPDHTQFHHAWHVNTAGLDCTECHGEVKEMHILKQAQPLSMGWCLTCHRENTVNFENPYYDIYYELQEEMKKGNIEGVTPARFGGQDCMSCHH